MSLFIYLRRAWSSLRVGVGLQSWERANCGACILGIFTLAWPDLKQVYPSIEHADIAIPCLASFPKVSVFIRALSFQIFDGKPLAIGVRPDQPKFMRRFDRAVLSGLADLFHEISLIIESDYHNGAFVL